MSEPNTTTARAVALFNVGFNCSQAILATNANRLVLDQTTALKLATGFGAGMGRMSETCGAVTGAFMVLGAQHGRSMIEDVAARDLTYELVIEFTKSFKTRHGSISCKQLLGYDLSNPDEYARAKQEGLFTSRCPCFVRDAAQILEELEAARERKPKVK
jgi:C_GCAxxG_C_C family probable redox protein